MAGLCEAVGLQMERAQNIELLSWLWSSGGCWRAAKPGNSMTSRKRSLGGFLESRRFVNGTEAVASKSSQIGNWMIWMVHRAHLDDRTLVKFEPWLHTGGIITPHIATSPSTSPSEDFTNLKMPEGNVEPLISPKLAVAMESEGLRGSAFGGVADSCRVFDRQGNKHIEQLSPDLILSK